MTAQRQWDKWSATTGFAARTIVRVWDSGRRSEKFQYQTQGDCVVNAYRQLVEDACQRNADRPTAFIDESYRGPNEPGLRFYILTAVVVQSGVLDELRTGIEEIADKERWHTVDELLTHDGFEKAKDMLNYLGEGNEVSVIALSKSVDANDTDLEDARRQCMGALLPSLQAGSDNRDPLKLAVLEQRQTRAARNKDALTHRELVSSGRLDRSFRVLQTSPAYEHLLWLPDLVSSAVRRRVTKNKMDLLNIIKHNVEML